MSTPAPQVLSTTLVVAGTLAAAVVGLALNGLLRRAAVFAEQVEDQEFCAEDAHPAA